MRIQWRSALAGALAAVFWLGAAVPASAQTRAEMNEKIDRLERQLRAIQRQVFQSESPYFEGQPQAPASVQSAPAGTGGGVLLADLSTRIDELERQLRALTGQLEELQHQYSQVSDRLERFERDVGLRLQALETGQPAPAGGAAETAQPQDGRRGGLVTTRTPEEAEAALRGEPERQQTAALPAASPDEQYEHAYSLLRRGQVAEAEQAFQTFLQRHPNSPLAGNAQYWLGETFYVRQDYGRAAQAFFAGYQQYGDSSKAPDSLLKLGMTLAALGETEEACAAFDELDTRYPGAEQRIKRLVALERSRIGCR